VAVGSIFPTSTKKDTRPAGLDILRSVRDSIDTPLVAIGGINEKNAEEVINAGADSICVATAVTASTDPKTSAEILAEKFSHV
jgi:thiamine-phosphate pyrophosphorylase